MIVVATWPMLLMLQRWLLGRRWLAVTVMTLLLLAIFLLPFSFAIGAFIENFKEISTLTTLALHLHAASATRLAGKDPAGRRAGGGAVAANRRLSREELATRLSPYLGGVVRWVAEQIGGFGLLLGQIVLTVLVSAVLYATGESAAAMALRFGARLAGEQGSRPSAWPDRQSTEWRWGGVDGICACRARWDRSCGRRCAVCRDVDGGDVHLSDRTSRCDPNHVVCSGLALLDRRHHVGTVLLVWTLIISPVDNILRPILIKQGADLPLLLIIAGVIGGLLAFGIIGLFVGPVVLAVAYTLFTAWIDEDGAISQTEKPSGKEHVIALGQRSW